MNAADDIPQSERRRIMAEEKRGRTYMGNAMNDELELGGRFAKERPTTVTGSTPGPTVPQQPSTSYWSRDPVPIEPSLGYCINDQEPVGEVHEIERSKKCP